MPAAFGIMIFTTKGKHAASSPLLAISDCVHTFVMNFRCFIVFRARATSVECELTKWSMWDDIVVSWGITVTVLSHPSTVPKIEMSKNTPKWLINQGQLWSDTLQFSPPVLFQFDSHEQTSIQWARHLTVYGTTGVHAKTCLNAIWITIRRETLSVPQTETTKTKSKRICESVRLVSQRNTWTSAVLLWKSWIWSWHGVIFLIFGNLASRLHFNQCFDSKSRTTNTLKIQYTNLTGWSACNDSP